MSSAGMAAGAQRSDIIPAGSSPGISSAGGAAARTLEATEFGTATAPVRSSPASAPRPLSGGGRGAPPPPTGSGKIVIAPDFSPRDTIFLASDLLPVQPFTNFEIVRCTVTAAKKTSNREQILPDQGQLVCIKGPFQGKAGDKLNFKRGNDLTPQFKGVLAQDIDLPRKFPGNPEQAVCLLFLVASPDVEGGLGAVHSVLGRAQLAPGWIVHEESAPRP